MASEYDSEVDPPGEKPRSRRRKGGLAALAPLIKMLLGSKSGSLLIMLAAVLYAVWPFDLVPDVFPIVGQGDDLLVVLAAVANLVRTFATKSSGATADGPIEVQNERRKS